MTGPARRTQSEETRDLQLVLIAGAVAPLVLGALIFLTGPTNIIQIPTAETAALAITAGAVAAIGYVGLRLGWPTRANAWFLLVAYTLIITAAIHYTGGPQTPMPGLYVLVVVAASFVLGQNATNLIGLLSVICYATLLGLEYTGVIRPPEIWRIPFDVTSKGFLLVVNWLSVATPTLLTAFLCGTLAARLRIRNQQLIESEQLRENLIEMLVHDLRNPLTALLGGLDIINLVLGRQMNDDQLHLLDNARHSGHTLLAMIGDLLDVAKMEAGQLGLKTQVTDVESLLADTIAQMYALAETESLAMDLEPSAGLPPVGIDKPLIQRVLANLVSNAIRHTPPGGTVTLSAKRHYERFVAISVRDTGEGIPADQFERIFEKFGQVDRGSLQRRGTGLGLTFCKMAVEAHGGKIWVDSTVGAGSTFTFTLPITPEAQPAPVPTAAPVPVRK